MEARLGLHANATRFGAPKVTAINMKLPPLAKSSSSCCRFNCLFEFLVFFYILKFVPLFQSVVVVISAHGLVIVISPLLRVAPRHTHS